LLIKTPKRTFTRHLLATTDQISVQSLDRLLQNLRRLRKIARFKLLRKNNIAMFFMGWLRMQQSGK